MKNVFEKIIKIQPGYTKIQMTALSTPDQIISIFTDVRTHTVWSEEAVFPKYSFFQPSRAAGSNMTDGYSDEDIDK